MDFRLGFLMIGILLSTLALMMVVPAAFDLYNGHPDWEVFLISGGVTLFVGVATALTCRSGGSRMMTRQAFLMTTLSWLALVFFASLPLKFSALNLSFTDAVFEAMSLSPHILFIDTPNDIRNNYQYFTQANMLKLRSAGYQKEFTTLESGIKDYVQNYLLDSKYF